MTEIVPKELYNVKDLYLHGERHADFKSKIDRRLAIISFHNSIENLVRAALKKNNIYDLDDMDFRKKLAKLEQILGYINGFQGTAPISTYMYAKELSP